MTDPVLTCDGHTYERDEIVKWFQTGKLTSPLTGATLHSRTLIPNIALRGAIDEYKEKKKNSTTK